jgi:hypothetical protein
LLKDYDNADTELLIYATSLINKTLSGISDINSFYDETDHIELQEMEKIIQRYMSRPNTDLDLLDQFQLYEAALNFEDGVSDEITRIPDNTIRKTLRVRKTEADRERKSKRYITNTLTASLTIPAVLLPAAAPCIPPPPPPPPLPSFLSFGAPPKVPPLPLNYQIQKHHQTVDEDSSSSAHSGDMNDVFKMGKKSEGVAGVTPGLARRRREKGENQIPFLKTHENSNNKQDDDSGNF